VTSSEAPRGVDETGADRYLTWDAAYVLGTLSSADRREFEAHMRTCKQCRSAVAELSGIPALLAKVDADDWRELDDGPPDIPPLRGEVMQSVLDRVRWRRRRTQWLTSAAVGLAAALLAVGLVIAIRPDVLGLQTGPPQDTGQMLAMAEVVPTPFSATVSLTGYAWGTRIDMACSYGEWSGGSDPTPSRLGMVVVGRDGSRTEIATWLGLSGATALPSGNTSTPISEIAAVQLVSVDSRQVLLEKAL
jgi:hypothetical protein